MTSAAHIRCTVIHDDTQFLRQFMWNQSNPRELEELLKAYKDGLGTRDLTSLLVMCRALEFIVRYIPPIILLIGSVGNILTLIILSKRNIFYPCSHLYLLVLAVVDQIILCVGLLRSWFDDLSGVRLDTRHWLLCRLFNFTGIASSLLSVWIIVAVTVERALIILLPLKSLLNHRSRRATIVLACIALTSIAVASHFFITVDVIEQRNNSSSVVSYKCEFCNSFKENGFERVWMWIDGILYSYIPFLLITIFNIIILINMRIVYGKRADSMRKWEIVNREMKPIVTGCIGNRVKKWRSIFKSRDGTHNELRKEVCVFCAQSFPSDPPRGSSTDNEPVNDNLIEYHQRLRAAQSNKTGPKPAVNIKFLSHPPNGLQVQTVFADQNRQVGAYELRHYTILLLLISGTFLITTAPIVVIKLVIAFKKPEIGMDGVFRLDISDRIAQLLMYINHAANFYLYFAVGKRFRRELRELFTCFKGRSKSTRRQVPF